MVEPVETAMFNVFDVAHASQWRALRARFYQDNEEVKAATVSCMLLGIHLHVAAGARDLHETLRL
jgi:hypothetical protein